MSNSLLICVALLTGLQMVEPATPNIQTYISTLGHHPIPKGTASGEALSLFLNLLQEAATQYQKETSTAKRLIIFEKEVAYRDHVHRQNRMAQAANMQDNREQEIWEQEVQIWGTCAQAVQASRASAINLFLVASEPNLVWEHSWACKVGGQANDQEARANHYRRLGDWHAYGIKIEDRTAWIYDSSHTSFASEQEGQRRRFQDIAFMQRALDLIRAYRNRGLTLNRFFIGGGGNSTNICQDMACQWLRGEVLNYMGHPGSRVQITNWEEITL